MTNQQNGESWQLEGGRAGASNTCLHAHPNLYRFQSVDSVSWEQNSFRRCRLHRVQLTRHFLESCHHFQLVCEEFGKNYSKLRLLLCYWITK